MVTTSRVQACGGAQVVVGQNSTSEVSSAINPPSTFCTFTFPISYNAVPPPAILTESHPTLKNQRRMDYTPTNYPSSHQPNHIRLRTSYNMGRLDPNKKSIIPPILMENLRIGASPANLITSATPAAITAIEYSSEYMQQLRNFVHSKEVLEETGYILRELSESEIERKKKCKQCGKSKCIISRT
jgi:hypothetical protein